MKTALVICPGRGTYTKTELGYLRSRLDSPKVRTAVDRIDDYLRNRGKPPVSDLDGAIRFSLKTHTPGEHAAALIYACSLVDFLRIDRERYNIVAITGNSMGWYTALALSDAISAPSDIELVDQMGSMMRGGLIGGQLIYPLVDSRWRPDPQKISLIDEVLQETGRSPGCLLYRSIRFGGYIILGGNDAALKKLMQTLPSVEERYPFVLANHAAFHTPLMEEVARRARQELSPMLFKKPTIPLIDGRGKIWQPHTTAPGDLWDYTLGHQVREPYDFSRAVEVGLKEFAPEKIILLGPGSSTGGAIGQVMVALRWEGMCEKRHFVERQQRQPLLLAMGRDEQRLLVSDSH